MPPTVGPLARPRWQRACLLVGGFVCLGLAVLGIPLPILPTTPLVLLAAFLFSLGSARTHRWLLRHRMFGPIVRQWQRDRCIPRRAKWNAVTLVIAVFAFNLYFVPNCIYGYTTLGILGSALVVFLTTLPTRPPATTSVK